MLMGNPWTVGCPSGWGLERDWVAIRGLVNRGSCNQDNPHLLHDSRFIIFMWFLWFHHIYMYSSLVGHRLWVLTVWRTPTIVNRWIERILRKRTPSNYSKSMQTRLTNHHKPPLTTTRSTSHRWPTQTTRNHHEPTLQTAAVFSFHHWFGWPRSHAWIKCSRCLWACLLTFPAVHCYKSGSLGTTKLPISLYLHMGLHRYAFFN